MPRLDVDRHLAAIDELIVEINGLVPAENYRCVQFRADLAGLLVVAMVATYENCVKEIICDFAGRHHSVFGDFAQKNYDKLNSRIKVADLKRYCDLFGVDISSRFKDKLTKRKKRLLDRTSRNIETSYEQILSWRHDFAHARIRRTTIEEAANTHVAAKRIMYIFDEAFNG